MTGVALTAPWIAHAVAGELRGRYDGPVGEVVTDSRTMAKGDEFCTGFHGPASYNITCDFHPQMRARLIVVPDELGDSFLHKPFKSEALLAKVQELLRAESGVNSTPKKAD